MWAPVSPCHRITLRARWKPLQVALYESLRISSGVRQHPNSTKNASMRSRIRARMSNFEDFRDFESGIHESGGIYDSHTLEMVDSRTYTPTAAAHQFSTEMRTGNPSAEDFCRCPLDFFLVWSRLPRLGTTLNWPPLESQVSSFKLEMLSFWGSRKVGVRESECAMCQSLTRYSSENV